MPVRLPIESPRRLRFDLDPSHRGLLPVAAEGGLDSEGLTPDHADVVLHARPTRFADQAAQFLRFGFDHILLGYDHLLFIAVLLVTAAMRRPAGNGWVAIDGLGRVVLETIKTLTAFTLAHAIVLSAALIGPISVSARLVEPAVAATIMLAAFDNIRPILPRLRWRVAFSVWADPRIVFCHRAGPMRLPAFGMALALGSFNLGIEAGQIALALLLVPIAFALRHEPVYRRFAAPAASFMALLLAGVWLLDRVFVLDLLPLQPLAVATLGR